MCIRDRRNAGGELKSQLVDGYAAPEQYAVAEFDGKYTDIYSLGALFYRALTGHTPVSYTHLDVYKRQWRSCALHCDGAFRPGIAAFGCF